MGGVTILKDPKDGHEHAKVCTKLIADFVDILKPYILENALIGILFIFYNVEQFQWGMKYSKKVKTLYFIHMMVLFLALDEFIHFL